MAKQPKLQHIQIYITGAIRIQTTREFLRLAGYKQAPDQELEREIKTVGPEQAESIKSKIESFKITEDWAKKGKGYSRIAKYRRRHRRTEIARKNTGIRST